MKVLASKRFRHWLLSYTPAIAHCQLNYTGTDHEL
jgi:hypothetical protein